MRTSGAGFAVTLLVTVTAAAVAGLVLTSPAPPYEAPLANGEAIVDTHAEVLRAASGFTYTAATTVRINGSERQNQTVTAAFEQASGETLVRQIQLRFGITVVYDDGHGMQYQRTETVAGQVRYGQPLPLATQPSRFRRAGLAPLLSDIEYTYVGAGRFDGVRVHEYAATTVDQVAGAVGGVSVDPAVEVRVAVRVFISDRGVVRQMTIRLHQQDGARSRALTSSIAYTAIGKTTVEVPAWLPEAQNRTGPAR